MNKIEQLERLQKLLAEGTITQEEFKILKQRAVDGDAAAPDNHTVDHHDPPVLKPVVKAPNPEPHDPNHIVYGQADFVPPIRKNTAQTYAAPAKSDNNIGKILGVLALVALVGALAWWMFLKPTTNIPTAQQNTAANQAPADKNYIVTTQANTSADTEDPFDLNEMQVETANNASFKTYRGENVSDPIAYPTDIVRPKETVPVTASNTTATTKKKGSADTAAAQTTTTTTAKKVQEFTSPGGDVIMHIREEEPGGTIAGKYREELNTVGGNKSVTYKLLKDNFFVVTGYKGDNVYYQKTVLNNGKFKTFYTEYPKAKKPEMDPITVRMSLSFK